MVLAGYAATGIIDSGAVVASAQRTLNSVVSHQNALNVTFNGIDDEVAALTAGSTFDAQQAVALADASVTDSQQAAQTINQDDASLVSAEGQLDARRWLTAIGASTVDRESTRIADARIALATARTIAADGVLDGRFWHALYSTLIQLDVLNKQSGSGDLSSAQSTLNALKSAADQAVAQSTSPGLPADLHTFMLELRTLVGDYGSQLNAQLAGDTAGVAAYQAILDADRTKLAGHDIDKIGSDINAYYQPLIARYNSELAAATS